MVNTAKPTSQPTGQPSNHPSGEPSAQPSSEPTAEPSGWPTPVLQFAASFEFDTFLSYNTGLSDSSVLAVEFQDVVCQLASKASRYTDVFYLLYCFDSILCCTANRK